MLALFYILVIAFEIIGGVLVRKKGLRVLYELTAILMIGGGIALCAFPLVFSSSLNYFDEIFQESRLLPVFICIATLALIWFSASAFRNKNHRS